MARPMKDCWQSRPALAQPLRTAPTPCLPLVRHAFVAGFVICLCEIAGLCLACWGAEQLCTLFCHCELCPSSTMLLVHVAACLIYVWE